MTEKKNPSMTEKKESEYDRGWGMVSGMTREEREERRK